MNRYVNFIMKHRKGIISIFFVIAFLCAILSTAVKVNFDFADYLPEESRSTEALEVMKEEYQQAIPNLRVVLKDLTIPEAMEYKEKIAGVEGVSEVQWLDDVVNIYEPLETVDQKTIDAWYKNKNVLFSVTVDEENQREVVAAIREIIGDENYMSGAAVSNALAPISTSREIKNIMFIVIPIILVILLITTTSWYEPFLFLFTIGIAILISQGTNIMFGTISFVTSAASSVLQLAVSMDYSIFLLHRFGEKRREGLNVEEAMKSAVVSSTRAILSSGLTTVTGFAALILMRFKIGPDMGWVMAKAIIFSLICVLCLLPVMAVSTYQLIDKTHHRPLVPSFDRFAHFVYKIRIPVVAIFILLLVPSFLASRSNTYIYGGSKIYTTEATQMGRDLIAIEELYGTTNQVVLMVKKGDLEKEIALNNELEQLDGVTSVISYVNQVGQTIPAEFLPSSLVSNLYSEKYSRFVVSLNVGEGDVNCFPLIEQIRTVASNHYGEDFYFAGDLVSTEDLKTVITADDMRVTLLAIGFVFLILLITFKSITIPVILTLVIETAIWMNLAVPYFSENSLYYIGYLIISSVQLGATIDYAILLCERYKESRLSMAKKEAILETISACTISIFTSASILTCAGMTLGYISTNGVLSELGILLGRGAMLSFVVVIFVLPILLVMFDTWIGHTTLGWANKSEKSVEISENQ